MVILNSLNRVIKGNLDFEDTAIRGTKGSEDVRGSGRKFSKTIY